MRALAYLRYSSLAILFVLIPSLLPLCCDAAAGASMMTARISAAAAGVTGPLGEQLIVVGGGSYVLMVIRIACIFCCLSLRPDHSNGAGMPPNAEVYNISVNSWSAPFSLLPRSRLAAASNGTKVYFAGGWCGYSVEEVGEELDFNARLDWLMTSITL